MVHPRLSSRDKVASIILAGGQGTRLFPLTQSRCKPSVCFGGRYRLIDIPISNSLNADVERIFVISQYFASSLQQHIVETYPSECAEKSRIQMLCPEATPSHEPLLKGTADAIRQNLAHLAASHTEYFLILSGDQLYNIPFKQMLAFAKEQHADLTIAALPVRKQEATRMGLLNIDPHHHILEFTEKPSDPDVLARYQLPAHHLQGHTLTHPEEPHYLASMGIYVFKKEALVELLQHPGNDFGKDLIPLALKKYKTLAYTYKGYWEDIGTIGSYYEANMALLKQQHCLNTYDPNNPICTHPHNLPSPLIKHAKVHNSIISQGSIIEAEEVSNCIVGVNMKIGEHSILRDSILLGSLFDSSQTTQKRCIGQHCHIEKAIIDEDAQIGNHVQLRNLQNLRHFDGKGIFIRDGIIVVASGTCVPDGFRL